MISTRRQFLGILAALTGSQVQRQLQPLVPRPRLLLHDCFIAGFRYHHGPRLLARLHPQTPVELVAEPQNPYDPWAVRVEYRHCHLGYLPRQQNQTIARLLQQGAAVEGRITAVDPAAPPWQAVRVQASILL